MKIGVFVGSLRKGSYSRAIANFVVKQSSTDLQFEIVEIGNLPLYNQDYDGENIDVYTKFREKVKSFDAYLFVTPEYNRSLPAVLKNAIDVASRPWGQNLWGGKPGAVISQSIGNIGGFGSNHHLRQVLSFVDVYTMQQPECYISNSSESIDENGNISDRTSTFLISFIDSFKTWIGHFRK